MESSKLRLGDHQTRYLKAGSGPPVVLIHGGASDCEDWVHTMAALSNRYCLYAPDLIGFGQSDRNQDGYYFSDFTEFITGFLDTLGLEKLALVGHSFGGRLCVDIALRRPEMVRKLVLVDSAGLGNISKLGSIVLTSFWAIRKLLRIPQPYPQFLTRPDEGNPWLCIDEMTGIRTPTLIIWKRLDPYLPLAIARRAEARIPGSRLAILPGYGHAPHKENKEAFNRLLLDFLDHD
jgi:pimeloyl-ACP methyl ester carboxylesterase